MRRPGGEECSICSWDSKEERSVGLEERERAGIVRDTITEVGARVGSCPYKRL